MADDDFSSDSSDPAAPREGPPEDWDGATWFDFAAGEWWALLPTRDGQTWRRDPPPVIAQGHRGGEYIFVTRARELREFTAGALHGRGGLADLFGGDHRWATRHYPGRDREGNPTGRPNAPALMEAMIRQCVDHAGYYDGSLPLRSIGVWAGPDGQPLVHDGARIFWKGIVHDPGEQIGEARYVLGSNRQAPAYVNLGRDGYEWEPSPLSDWAVVLAWLDEWHWAEPEALDLFAGAIWCLMLGDAPRWKSHTFVRAIAGSGKSTLLKLVAALVGGQAHPIQRTVSRARLEERFNHSAGALLLEEAEGDPGQEAERMKRILDLLLLLSDDGAVGGRFRREIDLHGPAMLVATLTDEWRATLKSRITLLELKRLGDRPGRDLLDESALAALTARAAELSPGLRARAIARFPLFQENLALIRTKILAMGGDTRNAAQVGHLLAGWACMSWDTPISEDELGRLERFREYLLAVRDAEEGSDDASECFSVLLGLPAQNEWHGGRKLTIGQLVARGREPDGDDWRKQLLPYGLRLEKLPGEFWNQAWLAIANAHPGLDRLFADYPQYRGGERRRTILSDLRGAKPSARPLRFAGPQKRALLVPPELLPSVADDRHDPDPRAPAPIEVT